MQQTPREVDECGEFAWVREDDRSLPALPDAQRAGELFVSMRMVTMKFLWPMVQAGLIPLDKLFDASVIPGSLALTEDTATRLAAINRRHCSCECAPLASDVAFAFAFSFAFACIFYITVQYSSSRGYRLYDWFSLVVLSGSAISPRISVVRTTC